MPEGNEGGCDPGAQQMNQRDTPARSAAAPVPDGNTATKLWIAWEDDTSIRSRVLADQLGAEYRAFTFLSNSKILAPFRYVVAAVQTLGAIVRTRPTLLVVQNPSVFLAYEAAVAKKVFGYHLVIDLHTHFGEHRGVKKLIHDFAHEYSLRNCDTIVVTNEDYRQDIASQTTRKVLVLPDKVPELSEQAPVTLQGSPSVLYICTFSDDEPWREVVAAAKQLPTDTRIYVSGKSPLTSEDVPSNVTLTGYLPRTRYEALLQTVDIVMVLTTASKNLVCGGYEAVAAGKPLVLSDTLALRDLFRQGTVFTTNTPESIADAIRRAHADAPDLRIAITQLKEDMSGAWRQRWEELLLAIEAADLDPDSTAGS